MRSVKITLNLAERVKDFVSIVNHYPYEMELRMGRNVVNAKSILGIFSMDLSKTLTLRVFSNDCDDLLNEIAPFLILET